jgi:hypothetical protein
MVGSLAVVFVIVVVVIAAAAAAVVLVADNAHAADAFVPQLGPASPSKSATASPQQS